MVKGLYQHVRETWNNPKATQSHQQRQDRMVQWRREEVNCRIDRPTRIDAARRLGYKAKQGVVMIRTRVRRGGLRKGVVHMKSKPSKSGVTKITMAKSIQRIAEERVSRRYPNLRVLNSYQVREDGKNKFFEVILLDPSHPVVKADSQWAWVADNHHKGRALRGMTSAGKRGRGLYNKGKGAEKLRPSLKANKNRGK